MPNLATDLARVMEDNEPYMIVVCQGPPRCELTGDAAVSAQRSSCPFCTRIHGDGDGGERIEEPGNA